jgi:hypothetical protein
MRILSRSLSSLLSAVLVFGPSMQAQIPASPSEGALQQLHLHPSDDTVAEYAAGSTYGPGMVIEVTDQKNNPVPGAAVTFRFPDTGASGSFADGSHVGVAYTDAAGHAAFRNIRWNTMPGTLLVRVTATKGIVHAGILVEQKLAGAEPPTIQYPAATTPPPAASPVPAAPAPAASQAVSQAPARTRPPQIATPQVTINTAAARPVMRPQPGQPLYAPPESVSRQVTGEPSVQITNAPDIRSGAHGSSKKWIWVALIGAGAGAGAVLAMGKAHVGSGSGGSGTGVSIGPPTVSIGHP